MASSTLTNQIYNARVILLDYLDKQGYDTTNYVYISIHDVVKLIQHNTLDILLTSKTGKNKAYIRFAPGKVKAPEVTAVVGDLFEKNADAHVELSLNDTLIFVKNDTSQEPTQELIQLWTQRGIFVIIFNLESLQFNVLTHTLVPPHRVVSDEEAASIRERFMIRHDSQFAELSRFDPVAKAIGIRPGQLCEITRPNENSITNLYWRICVNK